MSQRYVCRNVARIVAQIAVLLIVCGSDVSLKGVCRVLPRSAAQCCPEVLFRGRGAHLETEVSFRSVDQECPLAESFRSVD